VFAEDISILKVKAIFLVPAETFLSFAILSLSALSRARRAEMLSNIWPLNEGPLLTPPVLPSFSLERYRLHDLLLIANAVMIVVRCLATSNGAGRLRRRLRCICRDIWELCSSVLLGREGGKIGSRGLRKNPLAVKRNRGKTVNQNSIEEPHVIASVSRLREYAVDFVVSWKLRCNGCDHISEPRGGARRLLVEIENLGGAPIPAAGPGRTALRHLRHRSTAPKRPANQEAAKARHFS
jgi:hypothetical protein